MSVRSFHSVFMATAVAGAALGCYLVSLRVASERAALQAVEHQIVQTQRDIRLLQTEIGTRARLAQLERWNVRVLALSAPGADQILGDKFQLARLVKPEERPVDAPIVLAAAPAREAQQPFEDESDAPSPAPQALLHEASVKLPPKEELPAKRTIPEVAKPAAPQPVAKPVVKWAATKPVKPASSQQAPAKATTRPASKVAGPAVKQQAAQPNTKSGEKKAKPAPAEVTAAVRVAKADPLAPLPADTSKSKASRTQR